MDDIIFVLKDYTETLIHGLENHETLLVNSVLENQEVNDKNETKVNYLN